MEWYTVLLNCLSIAFVLVVIGGLIHRFWRDYGQRIRHERGRLLYKQEAPPPAPSPRGNMFPPMRHPGLMKFEVEGRVRTFDADTLLLEGVEVGECGLLTYRGRRLIRFDRFEDTNG